MLSRTVLFEILLTANSIDLFNRKVTMKTFFPTFAWLVIFVPLIQAQDTIEVSAGWNMIGAISTRAINQMRSEPSGIVISYYFGYSALGYEPMDTLTKAKGYWVRTSQSGLLILDTVSEWTCGSPITYEGKTYNTVQIGSQCWLKENIDVGTMVDSFQNQTNNSTIEKYCYNNDTNNCNTYGGLYQWNEAMQYSTTPGTQGICPTGWHIPTNAEYQTLSTAVSNNGNALKAVGQGTGGGAGTNTSSFSALLSGYRDINGNFYAVGYYTYFWSSSEYSAADARAMRLIYNDSNVTFGYSSKGYGLCVRCLKD